MTNPIATTHCYRLVDDLIEVRGSGFPYQRWLEASLAGLPEQAPTPLTTDRYELRTRSATTTLLYNDVPSAAGSADAMAEQLILTLRQRAVDQAGSRVAVHAAAVAGKEFTAVFPADSGAGKSTLVTRLAQAGMTFLGDEIILVEPRSCEVIPVPLPPRVDPTFCGLHESVRRDIPDGTSNSAFVPLVWLTGDHPAGRPAGVSRLLVVVPRYVPGATTSIHRMSRAVAATVLARNTYASPEHSADRLAISALLMRRSEAFSLTYGDVSDAAALLIQGEGDPWLSRRDAS